MTKVWLVKHFSQDSNCEIFVCSSEKAAKEIALERIRRIQNIRDPLSRASVPYTIPKGNPEELLPNWEQITDGNECIEITQETIIDKIKQRIEEDASLLKRVKEHLADLHAFQCEERYHRAIYECPCQTAKDYREVKQLLKGEINGTTRN